MKNKKTRDFACKNQRFLIPPINLLPRNRSGWIEIVEAFVAVLLIAGVVLVIVTKAYVEKSDISNEVYETELSILREVQTNDTLRADILNAKSGLADDLPIEWKNINFPVSVKNKIKERTPNYLECEGKICNMTAVCSLGEEKEKDIYSQSVVISATLEQGAIYRQLNLFCWTA
jgi:hypothetical protein